MHEIPRPTIHARRRKPLAACAASIFALATPAVAIADTWTVDSCDGESLSGNIGMKTGSLRFVVASGHAASGDTVDLSGLTGANACANSKISLTTGSLAVPQSSLELLGPADGVTIDSSGISCTGADQDCYGRTIVHSGSGGLLYLKHVNVSGGYYKTYHVNAVGGCIFSNGDVKLKYATASACKVLTVNGSALGGGIYAKGKVTLHPGAVSGNTARGGGTTKGGGIYAKGDIELNFGYTNGNSATSTGAEALGGGLYTPGKLTISIGSLSNNTASGAAKTYGGGACVLGDVTADGALISGNSSLSATSAHAGGLFATSPINMQQSVVTGNKANGAASTGAGVEATNNTSFSYTTVSDNTAYTSGFAGGLFLLGNLNSITASTISGNHAPTYAGAFVYSFGAPASSFQIANSTISGNVATGSGGGIYVDSATTKFYNSTIAFNTAGSNPGVLLSAKHGSMQATLQSTLMSNNTAGSTDNDLSTYTKLGTVIFNGGLTGQAANNLIFKTSVSGLPTDTKKGQCPLLGILRDNGGPTNTHALLSKSPAIDTGNYVFGGLDSFDQRASATVNGSMDYVRVSGLTVKADIGAYEVQQDDIVFNTEFEGCPAP